MDHGHRVRFMGGTYKDQKGWLNTAKEPTKNKYYVIVEPDLPARNYEKATCVLKTSVKILSAETLPRSWEETLLDQHPDIDRLMDKLAANLALCRIDPNSSGNEISRLFVNKIAHEQSKLLALGILAAFWDVIWDPEGQQNAQAESQSQD